MNNYADLLFVDKVRELQDEIGVGEKYAAVYPQRTNEALTEQEQAFIRNQRSFYMASVSSTGWPYVQHRGGPRGFLKVLGPTRIGFADYRGNRQLVTMGHAAQDDRVSLILVDYARKARLKLLGRLKMIPIEEADPELVEQLTSTGEGSVERVATIEVEATDWNCPQYIPQLVEIEHLVALKEDNDRLRQVIEERTSSRQGP